MLPEAERPYAPHIKLENLIECVDANGRRHAAVSWEETTLCGVNIHSKKDWAVRRAEYSCWECDGLQDGLVSKGIENENTLHL